MYNHQLQIYFFLFLFLAVALLGFFIFLPYLSIIAVVASLAVVFNPVHKKLAAWLKPYEGLAALLTILAALFIIFLPLSSFGYLAFQEAKGLYLQINDGGDGGPGELLKWLEQRLAILYPQFSFNLNQQLRELLSFMIQNIGGVFAGIAETIAGLFLGLIAFYYFLKDGEKFIQNLIAVSPLPNAYDEEIFKKLGAAVNSVVKGSIVIALLQGILTSIGFLIFGVPNPALWGSLAAITALLPGLGTALINGPAIAFLFLTSQIPAGIGLLAWAMVIVGTTDNILRPKIVEQGIHIHPFLILISVLGGLKFFGIVGFLLGPIVLSLLFALGEVYSGLIKNNT